MKKKITSLIMIVAMLLLPFSMLLTVHATNVTNDPSGVIYDDATTKSGDSSSYLVTGTGDIVVSGVNANDAGTQYDTFKAYKVIDIYYNPTTNQMSYQFTGYNETANLRTGFAKFVGELTVAEVQAITGDNNKTVLTVNDYLALTSDDGGNNGNANSGGVLTASTLNKLVSKFATYIRNNAGTANAVTGITMTNGEYNGGTNGDDAKADDVVAGSYLILPDRIVAPIETSSEMMGGLRTMVNTYGVMVANVFYSVDTFGSWTLSDVSIYAKDGAAYLSSMILPMGGLDLAAAFSTMENATLAEQEEFLSRMGSETNATSGSTIGISVMADSDSNFIPTNAHTSIKDNSNVTGLLEYAQVVLPSGLSYDYSDTYDGEFRELTLSNGSYYIDRAEAGEDPDLELVIEPVNATTAKVYDSGVLGLNVSNSYAFTAGAANTITITRYYIKDAYVDIGSGVTAAQVEAALADDLQNPTSAQQAIQKGIGKITQEVSFYVYGVKVNNQNSSNTNLSGGVFQAYSDSECTTPIGQPFTATNGVASFVGISGYDTIYVKQTKAPTGYKLYDKTLYLIPTVADEEEPEEQGTAFNSRSAKVKRLASDAYHDEVEVELGQDNYYTVTVVNQPMGFLPFTGGTGTIIYTAIGLLIVVGAVVFLIIYKKKNKKDEEKKD